MISGPDALRNWPEPRPRVASWPEHEDTWGDAAIDLCETAGLYLDPWQELSLRVWIGTQIGNPDQFASRRNGMIVPRQDGKGAILEARQLAGLFLFEWERLIIHTAHIFKTAQESFNRLASLIEDSKLRHRLQRNGIRTGSGHEAILLQDGSRVKFLARSPGSGRGFTSDLLIYDEAMVLEAKEVGATGPTKSARPNPQTIYTASAGDDESEVLAQVRDQGIAGTKRLSYIEYSAGDPDNHTGEGVDLDDTDEWRRANPAMWGGNPRMTLEAVEDDRDELDDENFARERLCLWWTGGRAAVIDPDLWKSLEADEAEPTGVGFAVDIPPERKSASIARAGFVSDEIVQVDVDSQSGTIWAVDRLASLAKKHRAPVAIDPSGPAGSLVQPLNRAGVELTFVSGREMAQACGAFYDDVQDRKIRHLGDPTLAAAVDAGRKRKVGDAWAWHRRDTAANISPLVAITLAAHVAKNPPDPPREKTGRAAFY